MQMLSVSVCSGNVDTYCQSGQIILREQGISQTCSVRLCFHSVSVNVVMWHGWMAYEVAALVVQRGNTYGRVVMAG